MKRYEFLDESLLLEAFQVHGDVKAFEEIYKRFWLKLYSWAYSRTASRHDAEEMVQIVFTRLWKNRGRSGIRNIGAYLAVSMQNILADFKRRQHLTDKIGGNAEQLIANNTAEDELNRKLLLETLEKALQKLPPKTQTVFRSSRYENKSVREIANELHLTEKAVEYHITRALKLLRLKLKEHLPLFFL